MKPTQHSQWRRSMCALALALGLWLPARADTVTSLTDIGAGLSTTDLMYIVNAEASGSARDRKIAMSALITLVGSNITVASAQITDGTITNADINASAAIALSKLATDPLARANHTGTQTLATISDAGTLAGLSAVASAQITDGEIVNADISASAAIALSKLATDPLARANHTGSQTLATISDAGTLAGLSAVASAQITDGTITNADINASAAIAGTKIAGDDTAYDATSWNGNTAVATKNAIRDKLEAMGGGGGGTIEIDTAAWVEADGNDTSGAVGDPAKPYLTMSAAYDAGARTFFLGSGTFAGLSKSGAVVVHLLGLGRGVTTVTLIESTDNSVVVSDLGTWSFTAATLQANGADGGDDTAGGGGRQIDAVNVYCGSINSVGGDGGTGTGMNNGGAGGAGGTVTLWRCSAAAVHLEGGTGGGSSETGGAGGAGGSFTADFSYSGAVYAHGAVGGTGTMANGAGGSGGAASLRHSGSATVDLHAESGGNAGTLSGTHAEILTSLSINANGGTEGIVNGLFWLIEAVADGSPTVNALLSRINGTTY